MIALSVEIGSMLGEYTNDFDVTILSGDPNSRRASCLMCGVDIGA